MKAVKEYINDREKSLNKLLQKPGSKYTIDTFHKLRVEIKKLKALFELINFCSTDFKKTKTFKPFNQIFKQAGKVRELQIEEATLKKHLSHRLLKNYQSNLKLLRLKEQELFFEMLVEIPANHFNKTFRKILPFIKKVNKKKLNTFLQKKAKSIKRLLHKKNLLENQLHDLRKRIKMINYLRKNLRTGKLNKSYFKKDPLPDLLGQWHDSRVISGHLKKTLAAENINPAEARQLAKIITRITTNCHGLFNKIKKAKTVSTFY